MRRFFDCLGILRCFGRGDLGGGLVKGDFGIAFLDVLCYN